MPLKPSVYRDRAVIALHQIIGGPAKNVDAGIGVPAALGLPEIGVILAAGDHEQALDFTQLKPLALKHRCDVIATYVDPFASGHDFVLDVLLHDAGEVRSYEAYRLWLGERCGVWLARDNGRDEVIELTPRGLRVARQRLCSDAVARTLGIARGQARMHQLVYGQTPFVTPVRRGC